MIKESVSGHMESFESYSQYQAVLYHSHIAFENPAGVHYSNCSCAAQGLAATRAAEVGSYSEANDFFGCSINELNRISFIHSYIGQS